VAEAATLASGVLRNAVSLSRKGVFEELDTSKRAVLGTLVDFVRTRIYADRLERQYASYPETREEFFEWRDERDALDAALDEQLRNPCTGAQVLTSASRASTRCRPEDTLVSGGRHQEG